MIKNTQKRVDSKVGILVKLATDQGWKTEITKKGRVKFVAPDRRTVIFIGASTGDPHSFNNMKSLLRRSGLVIPQNV